MREKYEMCAMHNRAQDKQNGAMCNGFSVFKYPFKLQ